MLQLIQTILETIYFVALYIKDSFISFIIGAKQLATPFSCYLKDQIKGVWVTLFAWGYHSKSSLLHIRNFLIVVYH